MMMPNSEQTPSSPFGQSELDFGEAERHLAQTKPWVRFVSILGFVMCVFSIVSFALGAMHGTVQMTVIWAFSLLFSLVFYLVPSIMLWTYGSRIGEYLRGSDSASFSKALVAQKTFWRYLGILALAGIALYFVAIAVLVGMGVMGAMR